MDCGKHSCMLKKHATSAISSSSIKRSFLRRSSAHVSPHGQSRQPRPKQGPRKPIPLLPIADPPVFSDFNWAIFKAMEAGNVDAVLAAWEKKRSDRYPDVWGAVRKAFEASVQTILYRLTLAHVRQASEFTEHALGDVTSAEAKLPGNVFAKDTSPAYPVIMLLYDLMERNREIPLWQDVERYLFENQDMCLSYFYKAGGISPPGSIEELWTGGKHRAIRYRIACFYYSFIREIHTIVHLREKHGLDVRCHSLIDTEWKADAICGRVRIELYVVNSEFKKRNEETVRLAVEGRKKECQEVNPGLPVVVVPMSPTDEWGCVWLFSEEALSKLAADIKEESRSH
ncbi:hypothetical protein D3C71_189870 [compost metagenome]